MTSSLLGRIRRGADDLGVVARMAAAYAEAARPVLAHLCVSRRCNLKCGYCYEYDNVSPPVSLDVLQTRLDHLRRLRTVLININGGEPLLHPQVVDVVSSIRARGMAPVMNSNGYLLTEDLIGRLGDAGLYALQISVDTVRPNDVTVKSLEPLKGKLLWLRKGATFRVRINTVLGAGPPEEAVAIARVATELGFDAKCSFVRTSRGAMRGLDPATRSAYHEIASMGRRSPLLLREEFMSSLYRDGTRDWKCRAGARYLWICEKGLVHFCESSYGDPGIPLEDYTVEHLKRFFNLRKSCSPTCAVAYSHQLSRADGWRSQTDASRPVAKDSWLEASLRNRRQPAEPSAR